MTLRHLFKGVKLSTLINKLGHAESYSFSLEIETPIYDMALSQACTINRAWCIFRVCNADRQVVPGWGGFICETGTVPECLTTTDYYPVINHPITDYATVKEWLRVSRVASQEVGQKYAITTLDLGVCMEAYPITWKRPDFYSDHIIMIG